MPSWLLPVGTMTALAYLSPHATVAGHLPALRTSRQEVKLPASLWVSRGVVATPNYTYLVTNTVPTRSYSLAVLSPDGRKVEPFGRTGRGPGELASDGPSAFGAKGDTLWVYDSNLRRMSFFVGSRFIRLQEIPSLPSSYGWGFPEVLLQDGSMLMSVYSNTTPLGEKVLPGVGSARSKTILRVRLPEAGGKTLVVADSLVSIALPRQQFRLRSANGKLATDIHPTYREDDLLLFDQHGGGFTQVRNRTIDRNPAWFTVRTWRPDRRFQEMRFGWEPIRVPRAKHDSCIEKNIDHLKDWWGTPAETRRQVERVVATPEKYPPVLGAMVDDEGTVWLEKPRPDGKRVLERTVRSKTTARVEIPRNLSLLAIGGGYIWGNEISDDDEYTFVRYRLERQRQYAQR